ncbi:MAG: hypothetical protein GY758_04655, partial [Fuerstiella sp.]|nr:hypothetical protein [Fuerstiella sp.]
LLTDDTDHMGPVRLVRELWRGLPDDAGVSDSMRAECSRIRDTVQQLRGQLQPKPDDLYIEGSHKGSQPFVLWKNRHYAAHRRTYAPARLPSFSESDDHPAVPQDGPERERYLEALDRFCSVFPDAFFISERGRDYVQDSKKQQGERGRLLSAGFHSMMGYFRDDQPLYDLILDETGQQELDV